MAELAAMFLTDELYCFLFNDDILINQQIQPIDLIKLSIFPKDRSKYLSLYGEFSLFEYMNHGSLIGRLNKSIAIDIVHIHCYACDLLEEIPFFVILLNYIHFMVRLPAQTGICLAKRFFRFYFF